MHGSFMHRKRCDRRDPYAAGRMKPPGNLPVRSTGPGFSAGVKIGGRPQ